MFCNRCGASLDEGTAVCPYCGNAAIPPSDTGAQPAPQQPNPQQQTYYQPPYSPYYPQQPYPPQPPYYYGGGYMGTPVKGTPYLVFAILSTLLCSPIFGIISIVNATKINSCNSMGDYEGARKYARNSLIFTLIAAGFSLVAGFLLVIARLS